MGGAVPNVVIYYVPISACKKGNQHEKALEMFQAMQPQDVVPNVVICRVLTTRRVLKDS